MADVRNENRTDREQRTRTERESGGQIARRQPSRDFDLNRDPFSMLNNLHREMERLFGNFGFAPAFTSDLDRAMWSPEIEIDRRGDKLVVRADLPGINKDDVHVELNDNILTIDGERKQEQRDEKAGWSERSYGRFYRSIALPDGVTGEHCNATFNNGVLEITMDAPQKQLPRGKRIDIK